MNEQERITRAHALKLVTEDGHYMAAVEEVRARLQKEWQTSKPDDATTRERIYLSLRMLDAVMRTVAQHIETGEVDRKKVDEIKGRKGLFNHQMW